MRVRRGRNAPALLALHHIRGWVGSVRTPDEPCRRSVGTKTSRRGPSPAEARNRSRDERHEADEDEGIPMIAPTPVSDRNVSLMALAKLARVLRVRLRDFIDDD